MNDLHNIGFHLTLSAWKKQKKTRLSHLKVWWSKIWNLCPLGSIQERRLMCDVKQWEHRIKWPIKGFKIGTQMHEVEGRRADRPEAFLSANQISSWDPIDQWGMLISEQSSQQSLLFSMPKCLTHININLTGQCPWSRQWMVLVLLEKKWSHKTKY